MRLVDLIPAPYRLLAIGALMTTLIGGSAASAWKVQDWRYGKQLAEQAGLHKDDLIAISNAAADRLRTAQDNRLALEQRLSTSEKNHYEELSDAQRNQALLRDRLATSDLRLSVLLDASDAASRCSVPAGTEAIGVVHGGARAQLDPAHAQRIIGITDAGDQGLIALAACQAYVREITH
ncbi:bacteriophage Rz lysis protein [Pseudomonas sp. WPR_5_2]|uniref:lysis system i-spanin subunit Rz n=1 Tax=Pseudomonas sp. WPR_5_2 TaxID=1907371 RepID=UPI000EB20309|nr:lysis system i-spanin subunit Rz [Pseudomonas sp. WPR_5_2]RKS23763.1 bacteriophage Rz lysis protein [Pseudomonas sp. WPR_5_2]